MVTQLIQHERIQTTTAKAKELRKVADKVVTYAKQVSTAHTPRPKQHMLCMSMRLVPDTYV